MITSHPHVPARHTPLRLDLARQLRAIRNAPATVRDDLIDWLFLSAPDHRWTRRLKAEQLLAQGHVDAADTIAAQAMEGWPYDPGFSGLRARCLVARGELARAEALLSTVLLARPNHVATQVLGACIAGRLGNIDRAILLLERAHDRRPADTFIARRLIDRVIDAGDYDRAERMMHYLRHDMPGTEAKLHQSRGRWVDAIEALRAQLSMPIGKTRDELLARYVDALERVDAVEALFALHGRVNATRPAALARLLECWLRVGKFEIVLLESARLARSNGVEEVHRATAWHLMVVAASTAGRFRLAEHAMERLSEFDPGIDQAYMAKLWQRAMLGRQIREQSDGGPRCRAHQSSILQSLLQEAVETLPQDILAPDGHETEGGATDAMVRACESALTTMRRAA